MLLLEDFIIPDGDETKAKDGSYNGNLKTLRVGAGNDVFFTDSQGSRWGGIDFDVANAWIKMDGSYQFKDASGNVLIDSLGTDGNFTNIINANLNTQTKQILGDFTFGASGAIKIITDANNGIWLSPTGILAKKAGNTTFVLETDGDATFAGSLLAASGTLGAITIGTNAWHVDSSGNMWWGNFATYAAATIKISAAGVANLSGLTVGTNVGLGTAQDSNGVTTIIGNTVTTSFVNALSVTAGSVAAENLSGTYITGKIIRTSNLDGDSGSGVAIVGGDNEMIHFYYNGTETGTIRGYTTEGSETTYIRVESASGRSLRWKSSHIACDGHFLPTSDEAYNLGQTGTKWDNVYANKLYQQASTGGTASVYDFAYVEMGLLPERMVKKHLGGIDGKGLMPVDKIPEEKIKLPFKKGTVLVWGSKGLEESNKDGDSRVVAIANDRGLPIVLGAEPVRVIGKVKRGDFIISTSKGRGKSAKNPDSKSIIGIALDGKKTEGEELIKVMIKF